MESQFDHPTIFFDGVCNLCNGAVQFVLLRDPKGIFRFAPLQSPQGQAFLTQLGLPAQEYKTVILLEGTQVYTHSEAALRIARKLSGAWPLLYALMVVPRPLRDWVYNWIARNRYRWFGRTESCMLPKPEWKERFL